MSESETIVTRFPDARGVFSLADDMFVERGSKDDWELLHDLHYKAEGLPIGPQFWKLTLYGQTVGVLVIGQPKGMLKERHKVFPKLAPGAGETKITNTNRYKYINANFRVISRFVVDTMFRGIGAGYRMMNLVSRMDGHQFMEIQSSMSKFNVFGQKAGFQFVRPLNANKFEKGMKFFRSHFMASPQDFEAIVNEIEASPNREQLLQACKEFYQRHSALENIGAQQRDRADDRIAAMTTRDVVKGIQQMALASPMYGIWKCPDKPGTVPDRLPLTAFDRQAPTEPLKWRP